MIERCLKVFLAAAVIGVGDVAARGVEQADFGAGAGAVGAEALEPGAVVGVHSEDQVEIVEIRRAHLARPLAAVVVTPRRGGLQPARVGRIADMPGPQPGAVDLDRQPGLSRALLDHALPHGRAADVTEADDQNPNHLFLLPFLNTSGL